MKKFIPLVSVLGLTSLLVCANTTPNHTLHNDFYQDIETFSKSTNLNLADNLENTKKYINNYAVKLNIPADATLVDTEPEISESIDENFTLEDDLEEDSNNEIIDNNIVPTPDSTTLDETDKTEETIEDDTSNYDLDDEIIDDSDEMLDPNKNIDNQEITNNNEIEDEGEISEEDEKIFTIYSLTKDIEENCNKYCEIKSLLTDTILETQTLINKIKKNEIELNAEERLFLNEQSNELKMLGHELTRNTNELNVYLKDINGYLTNENNDIDSVCLKYLLLLNSLTEGGNLMNSSLASLSMMNNIMRMTPQILPENNTGRILYGFQRNNEPPVFKEYNIDQQGNIIENNIENDDKLDTTEEVNGNVEEEKNVDSYKNKKLKSNIDSYRNNYNNIDSFFNTALLDNEFMFGNGGMYQNSGFYPMMYGGNYGRNFGAYNNQYMQNYDHNIGYNNSYGMNKDYNTQNVEQTKKQTKKKKSKSLKKNVDTYRDDTTLNPKQRFQNLKMKIANLFKGKNNEKINNIKNR